MSIVMAVLVWYQGVVYTCTVPDAGELELTGLTSCLEVSLLRESLDDGPEGDVVL